MADMDKKTPLLAQSVSQARACPFGILLGMVFRVGRRDSGAGGLSVHWQSPAADGRAVTHAAARGSALQAAGTAGYGRHRKLGSR